MDVAGQDLAGSPMMLFSRQVSKSCPRCIERCPPRQVKNPSNCKRCIACPPGTKGDAKSEKCIPADNRKPTPEDKKKAMDKATESRKNQWAEQRNAIKPDSDQKRQAFDDKKERMKPRYKFRAKSDAMDRKKELRKTSYERYHDQRKRTRARRAGRCLQIVPLAMSVDEANMYANEFFDEGYLNETMALVDLVPDFIEVPVISSEDEDAHWESDEYMQQWIDFANNRKRGTVYIYNGPARGIDTRVEPNIYARDGSHMEMHDKRFFWIAIIAAIVRVGAQVAVTAARIGLQASRYAFRFAKSAAPKVSRSKMTQEAKKIANNKNWNRCLKGDGPVR
jgi:hypothetical protein